jgi:hypothetical protein
LETLRLKTLRDPLLTLQMLRSYAYDQLNVSPDAFIPEHLDELTAALRPRVGTGQDQQYVWFAWEVNGQMHLLTGELSLDLAREHGRAVLEVARYRPDGSLLEFGAWLQTRTGLWQNLSW